MSHLPVLILLLLGACSQIDVPAPGDNAFVPGQKKLHILFIGNSLTYSNGLPALVAELGAMENVAITYKMIAPGGYSLEDHWNLGDAQVEIATGKYDLIVGQQGPSALPESQVLLKQYAVRFSDECKRVKVPWALYMVWPSESRSFDLDHVIYSYTQAAIASSATLFPAGLAWKNAWERDPKLPLYGPDRFHPGKMGSVLAAITIYSVLQGKADLSFINRQNASWKDDVNDGQLVILKAAAMKALEAH